MTTELEPTDPTTVPTDPQSPDPIDGVNETTPPPPPPDLPTSPITFEPATYYSVDTTCLTTDMGNGQPCPNLNTVVTDPMVYSNAGQPVIVCGLCGKLRTILSATKLDPQPEVS